VGRTSSGKAADVVRGLDDIQRPTMLLGAASIVGLVALRRSVPPVPGPLVVVATSIIAVSSFDLVDRGVAVIGFAAPRRLERTAETITLGWVMPAHPCRPYGHAHMGRTVRP
jgi:MFS superfamily sulfate permease-like transporter